jgi:hypothetical protein
LCTGILVGFLLSADKAIPVKLTKEITIADTRDISFLIFFPSIILILLDKIVWFA